MVTHIRPHLDEVVAAWLLITFGEKFFPGVKSAKLVFLEDEPRVYRPDSIYLGLGGKSAPESAIVFDEHRQGGRLQGTCTATLVAEHLRVRKPEVWDLVRRTLFCDIEQKVSPTELANLTKTRHSVDGGTNNLGVTNWAFDALDAIVFGHEDKSFDLIHAFLHFAERRKCENVVSEKVWTHIAKAKASQNNEVTELAYIASRMDRRWRGEWLTTTLEAMFRSTELFFGAVEEIRSKRRLDEIQTNSGPDWIMTIETESEFAARAASSALTGKSNVTLIRNSRTRHTQVFSKPTRRIGLSNFGAMIRMAEYRKRTGKLLSWKKAKGEGTVLEVPEWHMVSDTTLLNGSFTHPSVRPSCLTLGEILGIAESAFTSTGVKVWMTDYFGNGEDLFEPKSLEEVLGKSV